MNNNSFIDNLNNLINVAIGYGYMKADNDEETANYGNDLVNEITILLYKLGLSDNYKVINIEKGNVIPLFLNNDTWTDYITITKEIADKIQKETETLIIKTDYNGNQELWQKII